MSTAKTKILLVEDSLSDAALTLRNLHADDQYETTHVQTMAAAIDQLSAFDLVLLDMSLPDSDGINGFRRLNSLLPEIPIIILSGFDDQDTAMHAISCGASDYISKDSITEGSLLRSIGFALQRQKTSRVCQAIKSSLMETNENLNRLIERNSGPPDQNQEQNQDQEQEQILRQTITANLNLLESIDALV